MPIKHHFHPEQRGRQLHENSSLRGNEMPVARRRELRKEYCQTSYHYAYLSSLLVRLSTLTRIFHKNAPTGPKGLALPPVLIEEARELQESAQTVVWVASNGTVTGLLGISDPIKQTTPDAIRALHQLGLKVIMLTGDNRKTAEAVGRTLGIDEIHAELNPGDKIEIIKKLRGKNRFIAMAGDGINDAPALAESDVGIAMGTGTDVAMQSAGITLVKGDLYGIAKSIRLSRAVMRNIRENLFFAFVYNTLGIPIAAGILYPFFGILLSPIFAGAAMAFSSVSVIGNALRLRNLKL